MLLARSRWVGLPGKHHFFGGGANKRCANCGKNYMFYRYPENCPGRSRSYGVGERPVARPVFVAVRPPHMAAKPNEPGGQPWDATGGRSRVAGSSFNGGWRWWLALLCSMAAIVEGWIAIAVGISMIGGR